MTYLQMVKKIFNKKVNLVYFFVIFLIVFFFLRTLPHFALLWQFGGLDTVSFARFAEVYWEMTVESLFFSAADSNFFAFMFPILVALNGVLFREYYQQQKILFKDKHFWTTFTGMFFGLFGVGCFACSGLLLAPLISVLGLAGMIAALPYEGRELAYVGLGFIIVSIIYILRKLKNKFICKF